MYTHVGAIFGVHESDGRRQTVSAAIGSFLLMLLNCSSSSHLPLMINVVFRRTPADKFVSIGKESS